MERNETHSHFDKVGIRNEGLYKINFCQANLDFRRMYGLKNNSVLAV